MDAARKYAPDPKPALPEISQLPSQTGSPNPLVMLDGTPVTTKKMWVDKRRPELKELFQHYMYGTMPPPPKMKCWNSSFNSGRRLSIHIFFVMTGVPSSITSGFGDPV